MVQNAPVRTGSDRHIDHISYSGVILGGRLGYVLFYNVEYYIANPNILKVWDGGMSFHGGFAGVFFSIIYGRFYGIRLMLGTCLH